MGDLTQPLLTAASLVLMRFINTGDRMLDNALTTFATALISFFLSGTGSVSLYNRFVYYVLERPATPFDADADRYKHPANLTEWNTSWRDEVSGRYTSKGAIAFGSFDHKGLKLIVPTDGYCLYCYCVWDGFPVYVRKSDNDDDDGVFSCADRSVLTRVVEHHIKTFSKPKTKEVVTRGLYTLVEGDLGRKSDISPKKTFSHIFYDQKPTLLAMLDKFKSGTMYPDTICMDNKLGILLYGPPGTGKTGTISAIANYFQRDVIMVNFTEITTCSQLDEILRPRYYSNYIYVFDEFDCVLNVLVGEKGTGSADREEAGPTEKTDWATMLAVAEGSERRKILDMMRDGSRKEKKPDKLDLAYLLQKLDGIEDATGRMIIATTNYPQNINPALLRPGRFDLKLCLGNCSATMIEDILSSFYKGEETERIKAAAIEAGRWSPLQVINTALTSRSLEETLRHLKGTS